MIDLPKFIVAYPELKSSLNRHIWIWNGIVALLLFALHRAYVLPYLLGAMVGYGYLLSLFLSAEYPQRRLTIVLSVLRMAVAGFLIVAMGQFRIFETGVVFCGFLSYKIVLILEIVRYSVGMKLNSGK